RGSGCREGQAQIRRPGCSVPAQRACWRAGGRSRMSKTLVAIEPVREAEPEYGGTLVARTNWQLFRRRFFRHKMALVSLVVVTILIVGCFGAPWLAPYKQGVQSLLEGSEGPSAKHWFGTDELGRDQLTEIMYAGRISLLIGLVVALLSTVVGVIVGCVSAYFG